MTDELPRPRKRLGQHFLSDVRILDRIVGALDLKGTETVIEVGPGRGSLTSRLAPRCARLIAIELDRDLAPRLAREYVSQSHVRIVEADVLDVALGELAGGPFVLVGNVPYYITTPILFHALERPRADRSVFLVQREVGERMAAAAGSDAYGALSVNLQSIATVELVFRVPAGAFTPPPKVESAVMRIIPRTDPVITPDEERAFSRFVIDAFTRRRKQLGSVIRAIGATTTAGAATIIERTGISPTVRVETLSAADIARVFRALRVGVHE